MTRNSSKEIAIWRLVYAPTGRDVNFLGTFQEAKKKLMQLAYRNNSFMPSATGYSCSFREFSIENSHCKISPAVAKMIRNSGGYIADYNIDY